MTSRLPLSFVWCGVTLAVGLSCSNEDSFGMPAARNFADGCKQYAEALCGWAFQCGDALRRLSLGTAAQCRSVEYERCMQVAELPGQGWRPADYSACADTYYTYSCEIPLDGTRISNCRLKPGSLGLGARCAVSTQCESLYCTSELLEVGSCGVCASRAEPGESCSADAMCDSNQLCVPYDSTSGARKCAVMQPLSASCNENHPCERMSSCVGGICTRLSAAGDACGVAADARQCDYAQGLICNTVALRCVSTTNAELGQRCGWVDGSHKVCVFGTSCVAGAVEGESLCVANAMPGGGCDVLAGPGCPASLFCNDGTCTAPAYADCR